MDLIDRQAAIEKILGQPPEAHYPSWYARQIEDLPPAPPAQPVIVPCNYVKACNEATMDKLTSAVLYLNVLEELKKHGYVLVDMRKVER